MKEILRALRIENGLTQKELAKILNSTDKNIWNYEKGLATPPVEILIAYANYFEVTVDFLIGRTDDFGVRTAAPTSDGTTEKEKALLKAFKNLLPETQDFVLRTVQSLSDTDSTKTLKKF